MAEELVLARLSIDSSGVVTGVTEAGQAMDGAAPAIDRLEGRVDATGKTSRRTGGFVGALGARMFSLRSAAVALLGGLTLAGVIFKLAELAKEAITTSNAFRSFTSTIVDWHNAVLLGETAADALIRKTKDLAKEAGITASFGIGQQVRALSRLQFQLELALLGAEKGTVIQAELRLALEETNEAIRRQFERFRQLGIQQKEFERRFLLNVPLAPPKPVTREEVFQAAQILPPEQVPRELEKASRAAALLRSELALGNITVNEYADRLVGLGQNLISAGVSATQAESAIAGFTAVTAAAPQGVSQFREALTEMNTQLVQGQQFVDLFTASTNAFASAFVTMAQEGSFSFKKFIAQMLNQIGQVLAAWGALALGLGFFGYAGAFKAAAIFLAGAAAAFAAARAIGGGGEAREAGRGGGAAAPAPGPAVTTVSPNVTIVVEGYVGENKEQFARDLTLLVRRGLQDGVSLEPALAG